MTTSGPGEKNRQVDGKGSGEAHAVPERYGDYELIRPLAAGGMAEIFLARKLGVRGFSKLVVVKRIRQELVSQNLIGMFLDEAHVAAKLDHPHLVLINDLGEADGTYYIAMEYLRGQTLRQLHTRLIELGKIVPAHFWAQLMDHALDGLHFAHELRNDSGELVGLVHRDFTPSNIMVTYSGTVKLIDFGVAHVQEPVNHETQIGSIKGKVSYLSPEQCLGKRVDRRTDIFAAGAVLWELLSGRQLFTGPSDPSIIVAIIQGEIPPPGAPGLPVDPELQAIILKALERDLALRYQTVAEMRDDLKRYLRRFEKVDASDIAAVMTQIFDTERASDEKLSRDAASASGPGRESPSRSGPGYASSSRSGVTGSGQGQGARPLPEVPPSASKRMVRIAIGASATFALCAALWRFSTNHDVTPKPKIDPPGVTTPPSGAKPPVVVETPPTTTTTTTPVTPVEPPKLDKPPATGVAVNPTGSSTNTQTKLTKNPSESSGSGTLDFDTRPYTSVYLGRKKLGDTPMLDVRVPAGTLTFTLVNEDAGIHETYTITVPKGGHVFKKLKL